jgi:hypothetical protein
MPVKEDRGSCMTCSLRTGRYIPLTRMFRVWRSSFQPPLSKVIVHLPDDLTEMYVFSYYLVLQYTMHKPCVVGSGTAPAYHYCGHLLAG